MLRVLLENHYMLCTRYISADVSLAETSVLQLAHLHYHLVPLSHISHFCKTLILLSPPH